MAKAAKKAAKNEQAKRGFEGKRARFVAEYLIDRNATQAAIRAGYSPHTAKVQGSRLLTYADVQQKVAESSAKLVERLEMTTERIAEHLANIITADPNDLIEYRRECCRHCWGNDFGFQRTPREFREYQAGVKGEFDPEGGDGYNRTKPPNPGCPECFGEGVERPYPKDTRNLGPAAAALYAGIKVTKDGLEIKMHSKEKALELYGKHLGMFVDKHELSGPNGKELPQIIIAPVSPLAREDD